MVYWLGMLKRFIIGSCALLVIFSVLLSPSVAFAVNYWFNNAVSTNPATLGNYWLNSGATTPATVLPDLTVDRLTIITGRTYDGSPTFNAAGRNNGTVTGDAIFKDTSANNAAGIVSGNASFYDSSLNNGTVSGNATFYGETPENNGTVNGTKTRYFTSDVSTVLDYTTGGPWTVVADGAVVNLSGAMYDGTTTFNAINGGSFVYISLSYSYLSSGNAIKLVYDLAVDDTSIPDTSDFVARVNGSPVSIQSVGISGSTVTITLASAITYDDDLRLDYVGSTNPIQNLLGGLAEDFSNRLIPFTISVGTAGPSHWAVVGNKYYTCCGGGNINVANTDTGAIVAAIPVDSGGYFARVGTKLYVTDGTNDEVNVVDTVTDTIVATIPVGDGPFYSITAGTKVYIDNLNAGTVSVIDSATDTVVATVMTTAATYLTVAGTNVYVSNNTSNTVSVIDTHTDTIIATVPTGDTPYALNTIGDKVYVLNGHDNNVTVIDSTTNTATNTIAVGGNPLYVVAVGEKAYVANGVDSSISVIDTVDEEVIATIPLSFSPYAEVVFGDKVYVGGGSGATDIAVIDTVTDEVVETISVGLNPQRPGVADDKVYVNVNSAPYIAIIDTNRVVGEIPALTSFSSTSLSGNYGNGNSINISANFTRSLQSGSEMSLRLNNGSSMLLDDVSGSALSGTYVVTGRTSTPDLSVSSVISADITDSAGLYTKTEYSKLPSSIGDFEGENSFIVRNIGDSKNIEIGDYIEIDVGENPYQISSAVDVAGVSYVYVANQGSNDVSVIRLNDREVVTTIDVGEEPYGLVAVPVGLTTYIYVANINSDDVSVIDAATNTVIDTIDVGNKPYYTAAVGSKVYVTNGGSNTVSVIDTASNTVTDTISVGVYPRGIKAHGTDLYVANYGDPNYSGGDYISVIDSNTDTVTDAIILPAGSYGPRGVTVLGDKVYVANYRSDNVTVINTSTNEIDETIEVGAGPRGIAGYEDKLYVENFDSGTISIIDINSEEVVNEIPVGHSPAGMSIVNDILYYSSFQDGLVRMINILTGEVLQDFEESPRSSSGSSAVKRAAAINSVLPIIDPAAPKAPTALRKIFVQNLKYLTVGPEVKQLQVILNGNGFPLASTGPGSPGQETEKFGPLTKNAIILFQKANGLVPDGIVGPKTRGVLNISNQ